MDSKQKPPSAPVHAVVMPRCLDAFGNQVDHGKTWYWARDRKGHIVGTGKFAWYIGADEPTFFINGTGYRPESFFYVPAAMPQFPNQCEHGVNEGDWCEPCNRAYKEAAAGNA